MNKLFLMNVMMANILEEKLREASCLGDSEVVLDLVAQNVDINAKNSMNGWTALHWACKRNKEDVVRILLSHGADKNIENNKGERPASVCTNANILALLGESNNGFVSQQDELGLRFTPNYIKHPPLINGNKQMEINSLRSKHDFSSLPTTSLPAMQMNNVELTGDELVICVKIHGSSDPDFIEVEIPRWKLTYNNLLKICCEELEIREDQVERIRKLPNTRLRKDNDVKRLKDYQHIEIVLKAPLNVDKGTNNCYQSISTCKNQTILY